MIPMAKLGSKLIKPLLFILGTSQIYAYGDATTEREEAVLAFVSHPGIQYSRAVNDAGWRAKTSVFECRLEHNVPYFGEVVFRNRAGEASGFYIRNRAARFSAGKAEMKAQSPIWKPDHAELDLGQIELKQGTRPVWLGSKEAEQMMAQLNAGREITITHPAWFTRSDASPVTLAISNIGFRREYRKYLRCISGLLPANFDQLKRTALYFPAGEIEELPESLTRQLDRILKLAEKDRKLRMFYVDGHTDAMGDRADNLELSKVRAELVSAYLQRRGVPEDWIVTRWHGERYPVASNGSASGRAKNRRVTVRLERVEEIDVLPLGEEKK